MLVRPARLADERAIHTLVLYARRRVLLVEWKELRAALADVPRHLIPDVAPHAPPAYDLVCGEAEGEIGCFWASKTGAGQIAHLTAWVVHDRWPRRKAAAFLPGVQQALRDGGVHQIAYVGVEPWLTALLAGNGFEHAGSVITLQKADETVPDWGNAQVNIRPARAVHLQDVLDVDRRAFIPLWRTDERTLTEQLSHSPYFVIAEWRQTVVGYAYVSLTGRHGHLTRLVVDPAVQGARIGTRLLAACIDFLFGQGVYGITLNTQKDNAQALRLYRWFGFALLGQEAEVWLCTLT
jgi:ribosomal-protein-alanine N-acetyltransferase